MNDSILPAHPDRPARSARRRSSRTPIRDRIAVAIGAAALAACGGTTTPSTAVAGNPTTTVAATGSAPPPGADAAVLPVSADPITNTSTDQVLAIDSVIVENNVDLSTGKDASDHLEIGLTNTGPTELTGFEVYYTFADTTAGLTESYYAALPSTFTLAAGASRTIHFDDTGMPDHFADNPYSLYHTSNNGLDVTVEVSAAGAAPQTATVQKDPGGDEVAD
jgi:hypothetical protein